MLVGMNSNRANSLTGANNSMCSNAGSIQRSVTIGVNAKTMKPRSIWTGVLKISLVTLPVRVYTALNNGEKITFNQLHKDCHQRVCQKLVCPVHGEIERENIIKGYEYATDKFITMDEADLENVRLETTGAIDLVQFIRPGELDPVLLDAPYYLGPDGPVAEEGFCVIREALRRSNLIGIGRVVLHGKEKLLALKPIGRGLVFFTLRYIAEVRPATDYFADVPERQLDQAQVAMAQQLIETKTASFNPSEFADRYQSALLELIKAKVEGTEPLLVPRNEVRQAVSLMDALQDSLARKEQKAQPDRNGVPRAINGRVRGSELKLCPKQIAKRSRSPKLKQLSKH